MPTRGRAAQMTIGCLERHQPFKRSGFSMSAIVGSTGEIGRMPTDVAKLYAYDKAQITFTVLSYATPIAWVLADGTVKVPDVYYSRTTNQHQHLCRVHL